MYFEINRINVQIAVSTALAVISLIAGIPEFMKFLDIVAQAAK
jgi:hypothetical protein